MALDQGLITRLSRLLSTLDDEGALGPRLGADAARLWNRIQCFLQMKLVGAGVDQAALELACYALQFPLRRCKGLVAGKLGRTNLRDRCEQAAELLVSSLGGDVDEPLLDNTTRVLHEIPQRNPALEEARLLADALNLDDFGLVGLVTQTIQLALHGEGVGELATSMEKREQYGYWEARLKDSFHFKPIGQMARRRLEQARKVTALLAAELAEDHPS